MSSARLNYGKTFLLGFGFFGVSVIWGVYNAFVPIFLADKFDLSPVLIGFFMTLDNIAALFIQPPVGAWSDKLRSPMGRRIPFILIGAPITAVAFGLIPIAAASAFRGLYQHTSAQRGVMAHTRRGAHARYHPLAIPLTGQWHHQLHGRHRHDHCLTNGRHTL